MTWERGEYFWKAGLAEVAMAKGDNGGSGVARLGRTGHETVYRRMTSWLIVVLQRELQLQFFDLCSRVQHNHIYCN